MRSNPAGLSCGDGDLLQSDKLKLFDRAALHLQAELGCFTDTFHEFVERLGLGMAAWEGGYPAPL